MSTSTFNASFKPSSTHGKTNHLVSAPEERTAAKAPAAKPAKTVTNASTQKPYQPEKDMLAPPARRGASDALQVPSRMGNRLHYRDGRVVDLEAV
jgi:hypothetical protein